MNRNIVSLLGAATIVMTVAGTATDASAQWRGRGWGWGWGPGIAAGVVGGAIVAGAIIASRPPGYVVYEGYPQPVYAPGCYWASQPLYDGAGRIVGYTGPAGAGLPRLRASARQCGPATRICWRQRLPAALRPGTLAARPAAGGPPGYAGGPPPGSAGGPPGYAGGPPGYASCAQRSALRCGRSCAQRFRSYDPKSGTYLGNDGQRHSCP